VPAIGEQFEADGLVVEVVDAERRRINKVRIRRHEVSEPAGEKAG
jgi:CBS domain containing-hemolysin-like protein